MRRYGWDSAPHLRVNAGRPRLGPLERAGDPKLSTVADYIGAMCGQLQIIAVFPDERVSLGHAASSPAKISGRGSRGQVAIRAASGAARLPEGV